MALALAVLATVAPFPPAMATRSSPSERQILQRTSADADLSTAASQGNLEAVEEALRNGAFVEARLGPFEETPLSLASLYGHLSVVRALLDAGADVNAEDRVGHTPLFLASQEGHLETVVVLLEAGADVSIATGNGATPLAVASERGRADVVDALLAKWADPNRSNNFGVTPLHKACVSIGSGSEAIVAALLDAGADLEAREEVGRTPLMWAARFGNVGALEVLLGKGADRQATDNVGKTAVDWICDCEMDRGQPAKLQCPQGGCDVFGTTGTIAGLLWR